MKCVIQLGEIYRLELSGLYQDHSFYLRAASAGFTDFGVNICESYNRGRLVFKGGF